MSQIFISPFVRATQANGTIAAGALRYFYLSGTTTLAVVYADNARTTALPNPVPADGSGTWPDIFLNPQTAYRVVEKTATGVSLGHDADPVYGQDPAIASDVADLGARMTEAEGDIDELQSSVDALQGTVTSGRRAYATYASAVSDAATPVLYPAVTAGTVAEVPITDAGTHTDPVVGGTVNNTGIFRWSVSPAGWQRLYDTDAASGKPYADAAAASADAAAASADEAADLVGIVSDISVLFVEATSDNIYLPDPEAAHPVGAVPGKYYNNTNGTEGTLAYFGKTGTITLPAGTYAFNINGAPSDVTISVAQGVFRWDESLVYQSNGASGVTFGNGNREAVVVHSGGSFSFNLIRSPTSLVMADIWDEVLASMMVNAGSTPLLYEPPVDPEAPLVPGPIFAAPDYDDKADVRVLYDGVQFFYARTRGWSAALDKVQRYRFGYTAEPTVNNGLWDHWGERLIPTETTMEQLAAAFNASTSILFAGVDEGPPMQFNAMYLGGSHRPVIINTTITAHGFVTGDIGSTWNDGVRDRAVWGIIDANTVEFIALNNSGSDTSWNVSGAAISGSTLTHVSGGVATGTRTVSANTAVQSVTGVFVRARVGSAVIDGRVITEAGIYSGAMLSFHESYNIPNLARSIAYIVANNGASPINAAIGSQIEMSNVHSLDWTGTTRTVWTPVDVEAYTPTQYGGAQAQTLIQPGGSATLAYVSRAKPFTQSSVNYDFAAGQNISSLAVTITFSKTLTWADVADPPNAIAYVSTISGVAQYGRLYVLDDTAGQGDQPIRATMNNALQLTAGFKKAYINAGDSTSTAGAGQLHETVSYKGTFNPATDTALTWLVAYPKAGKTAYSGRVPGVLAAHWVPVDSRLIGEPVTLSRGGAVVTRISSVVSDKGVLVSASGVSDFELLIG